MNSLPRWWRHAAVILLVFLSLLACTGTDKGPDPQERQTRQGAAEPEADQTGKAVEAPPVATRGAELSIRYTSDGDVAGITYFESEHYLGTQGYKMCPGTNPDFELPVYFKNAIPLRRGKDTSSADLRRFPLDPSLSSERAVDLAVGSEHICTLMEDGSMSCWGWATDEQYPPAGRFVSIDQRCGVRPDGSFECWAGSVSALDFVSAPGQFTEIVSGYHHVCGLRSDGSADCCGIGNGKTLASFRGPFSRLESSPRMTCGIRVNNEIQCWGEQEFAITGFPDPVVDLSVSYHRICGLLDNGRVLCWKILDEAQLEPRAIPVNRLRQIESIPSSGSECGLGMKNVVACWNGFPDRIYETDLELVKIGVGHQFLCFLDVEGSVSCSGGIADRSRWRELPDDEFSQVSVSVDRFAQGICAIRTDGEVICWGDIADQSIPPGPYTQLSEGYNYACAVHQDGSIRCWGEGEGADDEGEANEEYFVEIVKERVNGPYVEVDVDYLQACGLRANGPVACWDTPNRRYGYEPPRLPKGAYRQISTRSFVVCGISRDGELRCAPDIPELTERIPELVGPLRQVLVQGGYACAIENGGSIRCWTWADDYDVLLWGQAMPPAGRFVQVSGSEFHACAVRENGEVECWGRDHVGQSSPPSGRFTQVDVDDLLSCGVRPTGEIECWGYDFNHNNPFRHSE